MTIEERIGRLEDIEAIRYLQAKYQRCLDSRDFDGLADCFTEDAVSAYCDGKEAFKGKKDILGFLIRVMKLNMPSTHLIHGGEIDWEDSEHAKAKWYLEDHLIHKKFLVKLHGAAIYHVEYLKLGGRWYISSIGYERCYEYVELRGPVNLATLKKTNILKRVKQASLEELGEYGQQFQYDILKKKRPLD